MSDMQDEQLSEIIKVIKAEKKLTKDILKKARENYYKEHGRWPEEDGITIQVNS